jgi:urea transport system permease protein
MNGLFAASTLLLCSLGMVIIFGNMNVVNLAHGEFIMVGAYTAWFISAVARLPFVAAVAGAALVAGLFGAVVERVVIKRFYQRFEETLLATYAISIIMTQIFRLGFSSMKKIVELPVRGGFEIGSMTFPKYNLVIVAAAATAVGFVCLLFYKTPFGRRVRAIRQNRNMAMCLGINASATDTLSFGLGCALAGLAGAVTAPVKIVFPAMGASYLMDSFSTVVVGGVDSFIGTAASSALISESTSVLGGFMSEVYAQIIVLVGIILILRFRPSGLFAKERR